MSPYRHPPRAAHPEQQYLDLLRDLLDAPARPTRNDTSSRSMFGRQMVFDLANGFPLLTTKKLPFSVIAKELLWFLSGSTNVRPLQEQGVTIWDEWADADGELGPVYGKQWVDWGGRFGPTGRHLAGINQIATVLQSLRSDPHGRRHIVTAWNPADVPDMALPPCHAFFQFYVEADGRLSMQMYQRSADVFLGVPFNIASYALLLTMFSSALDRAPGRFIWTAGDVHLYSNHEQAAMQQLIREPRCFPALFVSRRDDMDHWQLGDFTLSDYAAWPHIPAEVSK